MSYLSQYADASLPAFQQRVAESICAAAIAVTNESASVTLHVQRLRLAQQVLADPNGWAARMAVGIVSDGVTNNSSADGAIDTRVSALWNSYTT